MPKNKIANINKERKDISLPANMKKINQNNTIRIPILERMYEIDGELYYQIKGDNTPRKWKDYSHMDFN